jgi:hypothetical protein
MVKCGGWTVFGQSFPKTPPKKKENEERGENDRGGRFEILASSYSRILAMMRRADA